MPQVKKYDMEGNENGKILLSDDIFAEGINEPLVHEVVTAQLAAKRKGTASTKTRSEVRGGGRKPWRQKGTGRARHGSIRSPLWVGGGIIFGPKPRSYDKSISKKKKKKSVKVVLSDKVNNDAFIVLDEISFSEPKTKKAVELLENLDLAEKKVLLLLPEKDEAVYLSARNIPEVKVLLADAVNTYDVLNSDYIVTTEAALLRLEEVLV
ncbi:MAG: 50S ribosomal protein L4 [Halanaerobiaceae bacterium]